MKPVLTVKDKLTSTFYSFGCEKTSICWPSTLISTGKLSDLSPSTSDSNSLSEEILIVRALIYSILSFPTTSPFSKSGMTDNFENIEASLN